MKFRLSKLPPKSLAFLNHRASNTCDWYFYVSLYVIVSQILTHGQGFWPFSSNRRCLVTEESAARSHLFRMDWPIFRNRTNKLLWRINPVANGDGSIGIQAWCTIGSLRFFHHWSDCQYRHTDAALANQQRRCNIREGCSLHARYGSFDRMPVLFGHITYERKRRWRNILLFGILEF